MVGYEERFIWIFMNLNDNIGNECKIAEKSRGYTYQIAHISVANCKRVPKHVTKVRLRQSTLILLSDLKKI